MIYLSPDPFGLLFVISGILFLLVPRKFNVILSIHILLVGIVFSFFMAMPTLLFTPLILLGFVALAYFFFRKDKISELFGIFYLIIGGICMLYVGITRWFSTNPSSYPIFAMISGVIFIVCAFASFKKRDRMNQFFALSLLILGIPIMIVFYSGVPMYSPDNFDCMDSPINEIVDTINNLDPTNPNSKAISDTICLSMGEKLPAQNIESRLGGATVEFSCYSSSYSCYESGTPIRPSAFPSFVLADENFAFKIYAGFAEDSTEENPKYLLEVSNA